MKMNTAKNVLKGVGGVLAVCSALTMAAGTKSMSATATKKTIKKTASKIADVVDTVTSFM
ncbi:MAG: hypothetical protein IJS03_04985 [Eubacterium sp.]|nr:hypothetical protein [Eubacterium sp.]